MEITCTQSNCTANNKDTERQTKHTNKQTNKQIRKTKTIVETKQQLLH